MFLSRVYATRTEIPKGTEQLYHKQGTLFIRDGRDLSVDNPWEGDDWNLTEQGKFISVHGDDLASAFARMAGTKVGSLKPSLKHQPQLQVLIQRRNIGGGGTANGATSAEALAVALSTKV